MAGKNKSMIFGRHPVMDASQAGKPFEKLILQLGVRGEFEKEIRHLSSLYNIPMTVVPKERMGRFTQKNHQGIIGFLSAMPYYLIEDVMPMIYEKSEVPLILILDGVTDVRNFGAIARSAECCGVHTIVIPNKGSAGITEDALKTSAGALTKIPVCREYSLAKTIDFLELSGIQVFASRLGATDALYDLDLTVPTAIVMGSEGDGVSQALLKKVRNHFIIPQLGTTNSFNVSVASGIILYEAVRQRIKI